MPRSFNIVEQAHAQLRRRNRGYDNFFVWLIVRANLSFGEITLFPPRTCLRVISCSMLENGMIHSHHVFTWRRVFDREIFHDVVEIARFIPSSDPWPCFSPPAFFILMIQNFESYKNC